MTAANEACTTKRRRGEQFTPRQLQRLRELVRCMGCGAVPTETGETREVTDAHGASVTLPYVTTVHQDSCSVAVQEPRRGRPPVKVPKTEQRPAGSCQTCGASLTSSHGRPKLYCGNSCRSAAKRRRKRERQACPPAPCAMCGVPVPSSTRAPRKYCSGRCRTRAARARAKTIKAGART